MTKPNQTVIRCQSCGQPFPAAVRTLVDVQADPQGKSLLMANRLNQFQCPHCGFVNQVMTPVLYHDATKSLLIAMIPMEVSMQSGQPEEKIIGDMLNELTRSLPKEQFRAYMFNPKRALTMNGLVEQVMEADGITKEMLDVQKKRVELIQSLLAASSEEALLTLIAQNDASIDLAFFQTLSLMTQRVVEDGREDIANGLMMVQGALIDNSTYGRTLAQQQGAQEETVRRVAEAISGLGDGATRADLRTLALGYAEDDEALQALVGLIRPAFDYTFFMEFSQAITQAPAAECARMEAVRDRLTELTTAVDQQQQAAIQESVQFLQALINSPEPDELIAENIAMVDNSLMAILSANIEEAQRRQDSSTLAALESVYHKLVDALQSRMSPELRFINQLLTSENEQVIRTELAAGVDQYDREALVATSNAVAEVLQQQGQSAMLERLALIHDLLTQQ